jgi:anti-anti-sigma regulatory factor
MSEEAYVINTDYEYPVIYLQNYCNDETLEGLDEEIDSLCSEDKTNIIFDLSRCKIINSLGLGELLDVVLLIDQDYEGNSIITGINNFQTRLFKLTGIIPIAKTAENIDKAISLMKEF